jgi:TRAP-type mannitol/chloroaromatic compound transport system permease small subunit
MLLKLEILFDRFSDAMGWIAGVLNLLMLINVFYDAIMRYFFSTGSIALQETEWHLL